MSTLDETSIMLTLGDSLERHRAELIGRIAALPSEEIYSHRLPSGWTPLMLVRHLTVAERARTDGLAIAAGAPAIRPHENAVEVIAEYQRQCARSRRHLAEESSQGNDTSDAQLRIIDLLQDYARHLGQLDATLELLPGFLPRPAPPCAFG